ncbi:substrate-binding domain-containing protein, partial [bacterium]|nr:substrate-binding domain-containing protein [bacterium]
LVLYCAAGIKNPVSAVAEDYEREFGTKIAIQYGGSGTLLSNVEASRTGDLYLAADTSYIEIAREKGLVAEAVPVARIRPVIAVAKGNPKKIEGVASLLQADVKTSLANPDAASVGKQTQILLTRLGQWDALDKAVHERGVFKPTVNEVANDVKLGAVDAGIVWDATVNQYPELEAVPIEGTDDFVKHVTLGVLQSTTQPTAALRFARYLAARDKGLKHFDAMGFPPVEGDAWAVKPSIVYYSGGVNRLAIQETIAAFAEREGVTVSTVFNGCGFLKGQIEAGARPDSYHTCDNTFMNGVEQHFDGSTDITTTPMVIVVAKGNPKGIRALKDLARPGLLVGLANEKQSALGALTARLLKATGLYDSVKPNVRTNTPTADLLVNQIRTGSLDAVIVYAANTPKVRELLNIVPIDHPMASATQSFAIGKDSKHKHLMQRLFDAIRAAESKARFADTGFRWIDEEAP